MNDLVNSVAILGRPYAITRSRLGAITKVFEDRYICDLAALKEIFQSVGEKLAVLRPKGNPSFSFLISFSDQTHHDGATVDLQHLSTIPIGKQTERVILRWALVHSIDGIDNELIVTIRVSNPVNPLVFLQAALSKSPGDLDNMEFEMGSTCVTVDGSGQAFADEIFLRIKNWIEARNKPHALFEIGKQYFRFEWLFDQANSSLLPLLAVSALSIYFLGGGRGTENIVWIPILLAFFFVLQAGGRKLNMKMAMWAKKSSHLSLFALTNGDNDAMTRMAARATNSMTKLFFSTFVSFSLNVAAGVFCWWLTK